LLEAEEDQDPLTVLSLKGFRLPETIFSSDKRNRSANIIR
jgi:hypothetical protein